jgi:hypothetical protein
MEMDAETISLVLSVIALIFSIVSTIISLFYARKRIKIVDKEAKRKQKFEEASKIIRQVIRRIKENIEYKDFPMSHWILQKMTFYLISMTTS